MARLRSKMLDKLISINNGRINSSIRERFQEREKSFISEFGCLSESTKGRKRKEEHCPIRTPFQVDRDRIVY